MKSTARSVRTEEARLKDASRSATLAPRAESLRVEAPRDLAHGPLLPQILSLALPAAATMVSQIAYQIVDLYFVAQLGAAVTAGVNAAGSLIWAVNALTQVLSVSTLALVSHACGRKDQADARLVFHQGLMLAAGCGVFLLIVGALLGRSFLQIVAEDPGTIEAGVSFLNAVLPGFALMPVMAVASAGLRAMGVVKAPVAIYTGTVLLNILLAPVLVAGWGTGSPLGAAGAGLATTIAVCCGLLGMAAYIRISGPCVRIALPLLRPQPGHWQRMLRIGLPAGGEYAFLFLSSGVIYVATQSFGPSVQAGFGIASRVLQALLLPAVAVAFASAPIIGQTLGARNMPRVRDAFRKLALIESVIMLGLFGLLQFHSPWLLSPFDTDADTAAIAISYLKIVSCGLFFQGLIYVCTTMFRGLAQNLPSLLSSVMRFSVLMMGALVFTAHPGFELEHLWYFLVASTALQALLAYVLLRRKLGPALYPEPSAG